MLDKLIIRVAEYIATKILPSTVTKIMTLALILSLPLALILGYKIIILVLVVNQGVMLVNEFLYAKQVAGELEETEHL